ERKSGHVVARRDRHRAGQRRVGGVDMLEEFVLAHEGIVGRNTGAGSRRGCCGSGASGGLVVVFEPVGVAQDQAGGEDGFLGVAFEVGDAVPDRAHAGDVETLDRPGFEQVVFVE
ncbi:MAG: hypothetical protein AAGI36_08005, partial [Pseudomonadota bacterium]